MKLLNMANSVVNNAVNNVAGRVQGNFKSTDAQSSLINVIKKKTEQLPQYDYLFVVQMPDVYEGPESTEAIMGEYDLSMESYSTGNRFVANINPDEIAHRVFSIDIPFTSFETEKHSEKSSFWYSAKNNDIGSITIRIDELEDNATLTYLQAWMSRIKNPNGTYNPPAFYKRNLRVIRLSGTKQEVTVSDYNGCFPASIADSSLSYDNGGILQYSVTLSVDDVVHRTEEPAKIRKVVQELQQSLKDGVTASKSQFNLDENIAGKLLSRLATIYF